jgi:hypothetical protein
VPGVAHAWLQVAEAGNYPAATCQPVTAHWSDGAPLLTVMPVRSGQGVQGTTP